MQPPLLETSIRLVFANCTIDTLEEAKRIVDNGNFKIILVDFTKPPSPWMAAAIGRWLYNPERIIAFRDGDHYYVGICHDHSEGQIFRHLPITTHYLE